MTNMDRLFHLTTVQARILAAYDGGQYVVVGLKDAKGTNAYALRSKDAAKPDEKIDGRAVIGLHKRGFLTDNFTAAHNAEFRGCYLDRTRDGETVLHAYLMPPERR